MRKIISNKRLLRLPQINYLMPYDSVWYSLEKEFMINTYEKFSKPNESLTFDHLSTLSQTNVTMHFPSFFKLVKRQNELFDNYLDVFNKLCISNRNTIEKIQTQLHSYTPFQQLNQIFLHNTYNLDQLFQQLNVNDNCEQSIFYFQKKNKQGRFANLILEKDFLKILRTKKIFFYLFKNNKLFKLIYGKMKHKVMMKLFKQHLKKKNKNRLSIYNLFFTLEKKLTSVLYLAFMIPKLTTLMNYIFEGHVFVNKYVIRKYNFYLHPDDIVGLLHQHAPVHDNSSTDFSPLNNQFVFNGYIMAILGLHRLFFRFFRTKIKYRSGFHIFILIKLYLMNMIDRDDIDRQGLGFILNHLPFGNDYAGMTANNSLEVKQAISDFLQSIRSHKFGKHKSTPLLTNLKDSYEYQTLLHKLHDSSPYQEMKSKSSIDGIMLNYLLNYNSKTLNLKQSFSFLHTQLKKRSPVNK